VEFARILFLKLLRKVAVTASIVGPIGLVVAILYTVYASGTFLYRPDDQVQAFSSDPAAPATSSLESAADIESCFVVQIATFDSVSEALESAERLSTSAEAEVRVADSEYLPGWSPGRTIVFASFATQPEASAVLERISVADAEIIELSEDYITEAICTGGD
jgi:hypothetical protein